MLHNDRIYHANRTPLVCTSVRPCHLPPPVPAVIGRVACGCPLEWSHPAPVCPSSVLPRCSLRAAAPRPPPPPRTPPSLLPLRDPDTIQNRDDREHTPWATGQYLTRRSRRSEHLHAGARSPPPPGASAHCGPHPAHAPPRARVHRASRNHRAHLRLRDPSEIQMSSSRGSRAVAGTPVSLGLLHRGRCPACKCSPRRPHLACSAASAALARLAMPADLIAMIFAAACGMREARRGEHLHAGGQGLGCPGWAPW
jgi:hypothetical protein